MATRSLIGMVKEDKSVQVIYCHWDGYPTHTGVQLALNYRDTNTIQKLMDFGDRSVLNGSPTADDTYAIDQDQEIKPWIVASFEEFKSMDKAGADYVYIWDDGWNVYKADYDNSLVCLGIIDSIQIKYTTLENSI
jgi:hypothetical protein